MSKRTYPRIGDKRKSGGRRGPCLICKSPTVGRVDIQMNEMRGDDDVIKVCPDCQRDEAGILEAYNVQLQERIRQHNAERGGVKDVNGLHQASV